jgi:hypothetical protein
MKPAWDSLGDKFKDSKTVVIADVDCTASGKSLCDKHGVRGYPTIKYYNPPDEEGEDYKGGRDLAALTKFVETEQLSALQTYIDMDGAERASKLETMKKAMADAEEKHNELLKQLQATFKESQDALEKLKEDSAPTIKLLKAATPKPAPAAGKDEV